MRTIKVLIVNHFPLIGSGSGVYVSNIAKNLVKLGHEVCIIAPENTIDGTSLEGIKTHPVFFSYKEKISGQLPFNFPCFDPHPRSSETFYSLSDEQIEIYKQAFREIIAEEIENFKPDIIHSQHIWILSEVVSEFNIPFIITSHGSDLMGFRATSKYHTSCKNLIDKCKKIIAISKENNEEILENYPNAKGKTIIIDNGYDNTEFYKKDFNKKEVLKEIKIDKEYKKIVTFAGRLAKNKCIDVLLKAAKDYENEDTLTLIAGGGSLYNQLQNLSKELDLKNVKFLGNQSHEMLCKIYNISDVMAMPSREEAFGLAALEALACGVPVVTTNRGGMTDFINEDVGFLIDVDNPKMLADKIKKILNKEVAFDKEKIANYAKREYSQENFMKNLIKVYEENLKK